MPGRDGPVIVVQVQPEGKNASRLDASYRVRSIEFADCDRRADKLKLTLLNLDLENFDDPIFRKGGYLRAQWGYEGNLCPPRECVIQSVKGFQTLTVEATAKSILLHKSTRACSWRGLKRSQIAEQIAGEWGYDADQRTISDSFGVHETTVQPGRWTDAQFLTYLARQLGWVFYIDHTGFNFHPRGFEQKPKRVLHWYADPGAGDVLSVEIENDLTARPGRVTVVGHDPKLRKTIKESGSNTETKYTTLAANVEVSDTPTVTTAGVIRNQVSTETRSTTAPNAVAAKAEADARYVGGQQLTVKLKATIVGDPQLNAKTVVEWRGLGKRLSGLYYVRRVTSQLEPGKFTQTLECIRNGVAETGLPQSKGKPNTQKAPDPPPPGKTATEGPMTEREVLVPQEGGTRTRWSRE